MQTRKPTDRLPPVDPEKSCQCIDDLCKKLAMHQVKIVGILGIVDKQKRERVGFHTQTLPRILGHKPASGLIVFNFCPFCGEPFDRECHHALEAINSQN